MAPDVRPRLVALTAGAALLAVLTTGCTGEPTPPKAAPRADPTPLSRLNTPALRIPRVAFCDLVPEVAVADAVRLPEGDPLPAPDEYRNGDEVTVGPGTIDVAHEFSCTWTVDSGATARAWVFAPPVTSADARQWMRELRQSVACTHPRAADFGRPSIATWCPTSHELTIQGLFEDTWLACQVRDSKQGRRGLLGRAEAWCVQVANALNTVS